MSEDITCKLGRTELTSPAPGLFIVTDNGKQILMTTNPVEAYRKLECIFQTRLERYMMKKITDAGYTILGERSSSNGQNTR